MMTDDREDEQTDAQIPQKNKYNRSNHPDLHEINDWPMFGPQNPDIEWMVCLLTLVLSVQAELGLSL